MAYQTRFWSRQNGYQTRAKLVDDPLPFWLADGMGSGMDKWQTKIENGGQNGAWIWTISGAGVALLAGIAAYLAVSAVAPEPSPLWVLPVVVELVVFAAWVEVVRILRKRE